MGPFDPVSMRAAAVSMALVAWIGVPAAITAGSAVRARSRGTDRPARSRDDPEVDEPTDVDPEDAEPDDPADGCR